MAEGRARERSRAALRLDAFDTAAQTRKRAHACACHGVASFTRGLAAGRLFSEDNRQLAYMFMICSNIKLTTPLESTGFAS
jgi:hypothetical protein